MNLVDTSGWIEYFFGGPNTTYFTPPIEDVDHLVVPVICLYEVFKKINVTGNEAQALQAVAQMKQGRIVDLSEDIALSAALISIVIVHGEAISLGSPRSSVARQEMPGWSLALPGGATPA